MAMLLIVLLCLLFESSNNMHAAAQSPPSPPPPPPPVMVKHNCTTRCGKVEIPYPFGVGTGCFLSDWYEVVCQHNNTVPWLKKLELEVLNINLPNKDYNYYEGTIHVRLPMVYSNMKCSRNPAMVNSTTSFPNLEGSPFLYSLRNALYGVSCNAFMTATFSSGNSAILGCRSSCSAANLSRYSNCSGTDGCCASSIIPDQVLDVQFMKKLQGQEEEEECSYAFLADGDTASMDVHGLISADYVDGILEWGIFIPISSSSNTNCKTAFSTSSGKQIVECMCSYQDGNPYLPDGCPGIN